MRIEEQPKPRAITQDTRTKREDFLKLGFRKEKTLEFLSANYKSETLILKIDNLKKAGFQNPVNSIEKHPQLAGYDIERVVNNLQKVGFKDPVKYIEKSPRLAGYDIERVVNNLQKAGFQNPVNSIEKYPSLAGHDIKRIENYFENLDKLLSQLPQIEISSRDIGAKMPDLFGRSIHKLHFSLRILEEFGSHLNSQELVNHISNLIRNNPYVIFHFLKQIKPESADKMKKIYSKIRFLHPEEKMNMHQETKRNLPETIEELRKSAEPYDKFLGELGVHLELLRKSKEKDDKLNESV